ncbi:MAG: recombinase family protein [Lachnospiraceae bacterium]|nr:recombinase family protein [Lachnospiraceae bacterium]
MSKVERCAIYIRVSSAEQVMHGKSLDAQLRFLTEYAENKGWKLIGHFADEGKTARKELKRRKAIKELLECVKRDEVDVILFWKMDRWFRNVSDFYKVQDILDAHNCYWVAAAEPSMNLETREGRLNVNIMLSINQNETDTTSERIKFVNEASVRQGKAIFGDSSLPFGYMVQIIDGVKRIVKDPQKEHLVEEIFEHYLAYQSKTGTVKYINEKYGEIFTINTMLKMCKHTFYYGSYRGNDDYCPAYITREQYDQMQDINQRNIKIKQSQQKQDPYLFTGLFVCPICGRRLASARKRGKAAGVYYRYYRCANHYSNRLCSYSKVINENVAESFLLNNIMAIYENKKIVLEQVSEKKVLPKKTDIDKHRKELDRLNNMYQKGRISEEKYDSEYLRITSIIKESEKEMTYIPAAKKSFEKIDKALSGNWIEIYQALDRENKRTFWRSIIESMECNTESGTIKSINFLL